MDVPAWLATPPGAPGMISIPCSTARTGDGAGAGICTGGGGGGGGGGADGGP